MNKKEIIDELHKMGYEVKEETLVKNGVNVLGVSIIDSDRFMIPVFIINIHRESKLNIMIYV